MCYWSSCSLSPHRLCGGADVCDGQPGPAGTYTPPPVLSLPPNQAAQPEDLTPLSLPSPWVSLSQAPWLNPGPTMGGCFSKPKPGKQSVSSPALWYMFAHIPAIYNLLCLEHSVLWGRNFNALCCISVKRITYWDMNIKIWHSVLPLHCEQWRPMKRGAIKLYCRLQVIITHCTCHSAILKSKGLETKSLIEHMMCWGQRQKDKGPVVCAAARCRRSCWGEWAV